MFCSPVLKPSRFHSPCSGGAELHSPKSAFPCCLLSPRASLESGARVLKAAFPAAGTASYGCCAVQQSLTALL